MFVRTLHAKPFSVETPNFACRSHLYVGWCRKEWFFRTLKIGRFARKKHAKIRFFMFVRTLYAKLFSVENSNFAWKSELYMGCCRKEWFFRNLKIGRFPRKKHAKIRFFMFVRTLYAKPFSVETPNFACRSHLAQSGPPQLGVVLVFWVVLTKVHNTAFNTIKVNTPVYSPRWKTV